MKCGASNIQVISEYDKPAIQLWTLKEFKRNCGRNLQQIELLVPHVWIAQSSSQQSSQYKGRVFGVQKDVQIANYQGDKI